MPAPYVFLHPLLYLLLLLLIYLHLPAQSQSGIPVQWTGFLFPSVFPLLSIILASLQEGTSVSRSVNPSVWLSVGPSHLIWNHVFDQNWVKGLKQESTTIWAYKVVIVKKLQVNVKQSIMSTSENASIDQTLFDLFFLLIRRAPWHFFRCVLASVWEALSVLPSTCPSVRMF